MLTLHQINILLHVLAGSLALLSGIIALAVGKGSRRHLRTGRFFAWMLAIVVSTGAFGVLVYHRNPFLLLITVLAGYNTWSGIRTLRLAGRRPTVPDMLMPLAAGVFAGWYVYHLDAIGFYWSPVIIWSTVGALLVVMGYDCSRWLLPAAFRRRAMLYEHAYKMIGAFSGILSAFTGTVLPQYKPYSQFMPSVIGMLGIIITFIWLSRRNHPLNYMLAAKQTTHAQSR